MRGFAFREYVTGSDEGFPGFVAASIEQLRARLLATGAVDAFDLDAVVASLRDPEKALLTFECWVASGRRPD
ncbi:MAG: hypothetical protein E6J87_17000 [Deltaproteobacteria bacterium]|nr:MAG: hypothetical protein E6J87_17000 [Deltaproteobacteria bacterium]